MVLNKGYRTHDIGLVTQQSS